HQQMKSTEVQPNDILLNITGGSLGRCAVVPSDFERGNVSQHVCILRPVLVETQYLHCFILSGYFSQTMKVTGSGREGLPKYNLGKMVIPIPPLNEQTHIVAEINRWFSLISDLKRNESELNETVKVTKAKVLDLAIHGKLVPQDPNDEPAVELSKRINPAIKPCDTSHYGNLPSSWCVCSIKDVFNITMGSSPSGSSLNKEREGVEFHQGKICFTDKYLEESDIYTCMPTKLAEAHCILLCVRAPVGVVNITEREICIGRGLCALKPKTGVDFMFAYYALQTHKEHFEERASGSTFNAIGRDTIRNESFILPPYKEQVRIRERIEVVLRQIDTIKEAL
nr:restriction endonuclease subunit S [Bacteroidales bacterium]